MSTIERTEPDVREARASTLAGWGLMAGGAAFFVGGSLHPGDDPPGLTLKQHLLLLYEDSTWYPSHALLLLAMVLIAASLVTLVRSGSLASARVYPALTLAAIAAVLGAAASVVHLVAATEADRIAAGNSTPITDVSLAVETLINPAVGLSFAAVAVIGALTGTLGYRVAAVFGVVGGLAYALAGGTAVFTDALNFLFPVSAGIAVWAFAVGLGLVLRAHRAGARSIDARSVRSSQERYSSAVQP